MTADSIQNTYPCPICGRKFIQESLKKHEIACQKLNSKKRKVFDSGKQRATGSDINYKDIKKVQNEKQKFGGTFPRPKTNWKERHETFIGAVSASKQVEIAIKTGAPLPPPPKATVPNDYIECEFCGRNFNEKAAERHIPFCKEQSMRKKTPASRSASASRAIIASGKSQPTSAPTRREPMNSKGLSIKPSSRNSSVEKTSLTKSTTNIIVPSQPKVNTTSKKSSNLPMPTKRSSSTNRSSSTLNNSYSHQNLQLSKLSNKNVPRKQCSEMIEKDKEEKKDQTEKTFNGKTLSDERSNEDYYIEYQKFKDETLRKPSSTITTRTTKSPTPREIDYDFD
uniref:Zinc finger C2HC domain-containing protein 1A n=1 Tax=Strongyloides papillosus TaxID=174720 RepID=A0A0N5BAX7_STREA